MKRFFGRLPKQALALALVLTILPFAPVFMQLALASDPATNGNTITSIVIPPGGFNSGNTSTTGNLDVRISGNATLTGSGGARLVANAGNQRGGVFFSEPIEQNTGFSASFQMRMGAGSGQVADGFTFVLARHTNQVGAIGQGLGYSGIGNSIAIEFDTFDNRSGGGNGTVPHIWYGTNGTMDTADNHRLVLFERTGGTFSGADANGRGGSWTGGQSAWRNVRNYTVHGWIEYDQYFTELRVTYSSSPERPEHPTFILRERDKGQTNHWDNNGATYVAYDSNFVPSEILGAYYFVGFTAATGGSMQDTTLLTFSAFGEVANPNDPLDPNINRHLVLVDGRGGTTDLFVGAGIDLPFINPIGVLPPDDDEGTRFQGFFTEEGVQYYNASGNPIRVNDLEHNTRLYARFSHTIKLRNQGVADGGLIAHPNQELPATLEAGGASIPRRDGFRFLGYYDALGSEGIPYYDAEGNRVFGSTPWQPLDPNLPTAEQADGTGPNTLYAQWLRLGSGVGVHLDGGEWSNVPAVLRPTGSEDVFDTAYLPDGLPGGTTIGLPRPTREDHAFNGWEIDGEGGSLNGDVLTITGGGANVTITARWVALDTAVRVTYNIIGEPPRIYTRDPGLEAAFQPRNLVFNDREGITAGDMARGNVRLALYVNDIKTDDANFAGAISAINTHAGESFMRAALGKLTFYEIYVEKTVAGGPPVRLSSLPVPVTVRIELPLALRGYTGYTIFQRHAVFNEATESYIHEVADISDYGGNFRIDGEFLVLEVSNFSEFAILPNGAHIHFLQRHFDENSGACENCPYCRFHLPGVTEHGTTVGNWEDFDVRARIVETHAPIYKLDIEWGDMKFVFSLDYVQEWDSEGRLVRTDHGERVNDWVASGYTDGNNMITVRNHSNDGVDVSFSIPWQANYLAGISVEVKQENNANAAPAQNMPLGRVPYRGAEAPYLQAWLRMSGNPDVDKFIEEFEATGGDTTDLNTGSWLHVATITVTVTPEHGELTP